jgi:MFS family permease
LVHWRYKWAVVGMRWFVCFLNYADRMAISSALPILEQEYGFNKQQLGLISSAFMWVYALTAPLAGQAADRFSRKTLILGGLFVWSFVTGLTAICTKVWQFIFVRGSEGLGETFYFPASMSLISDYHGPPTRSRAMSIHQTSVYAGTIVGSIGTAWLIDRAGLALPWQAPFLIFGTLGVALAFVLWFFINEPKRNEAEYREALGQCTDSDSVAEIARRVPLSQFLPDVVRRPTVLLLILAFIAANVVAGVVLSWTTTFIFEKFGWRLEGFGPSLFLASVVAMLSIQIGSMVGSVLGGVMADLLRRRWAPGRVFVQAVGLFAGTPFLTACGLVSELWLVVICLFLLGLCKGIYDSNIWAALYDFVDPARRGTAVGFTNMVGWIGAGVGAFGVGFFVHRGTPMSEAFAAIGGIYFFGAASLLVAALVFAPGDFREGESRFPNGPAREMTSREERLRL